MFNRKKYKNFAIKMLKGRWTVPVLITLTTSIISWIFLIPSGIRFFTSDKGQSLLYADISYWGSFYDFWYAFSDAFDSAFTDVSSIILSIVTTILDVAAIGVYLKMSRSPEKVSYKQFIIGLNNWWKATLGFFWNFLWTTIWMFLFIIPGIIKSIAYSQMYYILAEFPKVSVTKSMRISIIITKGHKWDLFVLYLSFIGWELLSCLTLGIGNLWLIPYMNMTLTNAYHAMLKEAIESGKILPEDLQ